MDDPGSELERVGRTSDKVKGWIDGDIGTSENNLTGIGDIDRAHIRAIGKNQKPGPRLDIFRKYQIDVAGQRHPLRIICGSGARQHRRSVVDE